MNLKLKLLIRPETVNKQTLVRRDGNQEEKHYSIHHFPATKLSIHRIFYEGLWLTYVLKYNRALFNQNSDYNVLIVNSSKYY